MDHDRVHADLLHQHHVARHQVAELGIGHGVAAVLHDEGRVVVPAHVGQGLGDGLRHADEPLLLLVGLDRDVRPCQCIPRLRKSPLPGRERAKAASYIRRRADRRSRAARQDVLPCSTAKISPIVASPWRAAWSGPRSAGRWPRCGPSRTRFRKHIVMQRHGYGQGEYQYFRYPLPEPVERLRQALYPELAAVANRWNEALGIERRFPPTLEGWLRECHAGGQERPTPLLLRYGPGDYNCLHRDLYGDLVFPMQATILLSRARPRLRRAASSCWSSSGRACSRAARSCRCAGRRGAVRGQPAAGEGHARLASHRHAPRRLEPAQRRALHAGHHLPRRGLTARRERDQWPSATSMTSARSSAMPKPVSLLVGSTWDGRRHACAPPPRPRRRPWESAAVLEMVGLGQDELVGHRGGVEVLHRLAVGVLHAVARIDQQADALERRPAAQEGRGEILPGLLHRPRHLGEAVARQVDQDRAGLAEIEEIDLPRVARARRGAGERAPAGQRVDQARLADIGAAGEGDLGQRDRRSATSNEAAPAMNSQGPAKSLRAASIVRGRVPLGS